MVQKGPRPLVLCGPSGSGKSTLLKRLLKDFPDKFGFSVSHTTRSPRPGEKDGVHYHFTTTNDILGAIEKGEFIETATFSGNMYGTSKQAVEDVRRTGRTCILDIEIEGVKQIKKTDLDPLLVFVMPPSIEQLEKRLRARNTEQEDALKKRLETACREIVYGQEPGNFHIIIVNDNLNKAYSELRDFVLQYLQSKDPGIHFSVFVQEPRLQTATALSHRHPSGQRTLHRDPSLNPKLCQPVAALQLIRPFSAGGGG